MPIERLQRPRKAPLGGIDVFLLTGQGLDALLKGVQWCSANVVPNTWHNAKHTVQNTRERHTENVFLVGQVCEDARTGKHVGGA